MTRSHVRMSAIALTALLFCGSGSIFAQSKTDAVPGGPSKSNPKIVEIFKSAVANAADNSVAVLVGGKQVALGTIIKADGYILTKDSELKGDSIVVRLKNGTQLDAKKISANNTWDLAMLKVDAKDLKPVTWDDSKVAPVGNWVATTAPSDKPIAYGVVSVAARVMPPGPKVPLPKDLANRGYLGIRMENNEDGAGVKIVAVEPGAPAQKAGIKANDIVIAVDGAETPDVETLAATIGNRKPNDVVIIRVMRNEKEEEFEATLAKRPSSGFDRGEFQNSMGTSRSDRRTGFPITLQHDTDLKADQCGGPLVDLEGRVIGINIARGGRTDTYAIPSEEIRPLLADLIAAKPNAQQVLNALAEKVRAAQATLRGAQATLKAAETEKAAAEKKVAEAKAILDALLAEQKKESAKK